MIRFNWPNLIRFKSVPDFMCKQNTYNIQPVAVFFYINISVYCNPLGGWKQFCAGTTGRLFFEGQQKQRPPARMLTTDFMKCNLVHYLIRNVKRFNQISKKAATVDLTTYYNQLTRWVFLATHLKMWWKAVRTVTKELKNLTTPFSPQKKRHKILIA